MPAESRVSPERIEEQVRELRQAEHEMREWAARWPTASPYNAAALRWAVACRDVLALLDTQAGKECACGGANDHCGGECSGAFDKLAQKLQEAKARIAALEEALAWRPIETAPEAERVWVWVPNLGAKIAQKTTHPSDGAVWWDSEEIVSKPTRWLPLPRGPQP